MLIVTALVWPHSGWAGERTLSLIRPLALPPQAAMSTSPPASHTGAPRSLIHRPPVAHDQELRPAEQTRTAPHQPHRLILQPPMLSLPDPPNPTRASKPVSRKLTRWPPAGGRF